MPYKFSSAKLKLNSLKMNTWFLSLLFLLGCFPLPAQPFYFGTDLSYIREMEDCGAGFKENGVLKDPFEIMRDHGCNLVRLRLWHTPSWYDQLNLGNRYSDFNDVVFAIFRAKSFGMQVLLDFQLSDTWADPTHQVVPAAWAGVVDNLPVLQDSLYQYIYRTLNDLALGLVLPDIVQIGNETNKGILLSQAVNDQGWSVDWTRNAALFNSAIAAVRQVESETGSPIKIALHIADPSELNWWMGQFWTNGVQDFDIIGMSYYHQYHQDLIPDVGDVISNMKNTYPGKAVMILETAYPWTSAFDDSAANLLHTVYPGYPFSPANQEKWMEDLTQVVIDHGGSGVVYWEPGWVSTDCFTQYGKGSNWENCTFFDFNDNLINDGGVAWMSANYDFTSATHECHTGSPNIQLYQAEDEVILRRTNENIWNASLFAGLYALDGKSIYQQNFSPAWEHNVLRLPLPALPNGVYLFTIKPSTSFPVSRLIFQ
jgi:arabinogalactan endo-1,4-beta-galactosidase